MIRGIYRIHGVDGHPDDVRVVDDGIEVPLAESLYRARGYLPPVENLPWREEYFAPKQSSADAAATKASVDKAAREQARQAFVATLPKT